MLHVRMLSGEAVTSILVEEMDDVEALKQRLTQLHGFPPRFRQRVLFNGEILEEGLKLDSPKTLDLILLTFADDVSGFKRKSLQPLLRRAPFPRLEGWAKAYLPSTLL